MATFNSVANVSARNEKKKKLNLGDTAYVYMSGGVHSPDARPKKKYIKGKELLVDQEKQCVNQGKMELLQKVFLKK